MATNRIARAVDHSALIGLRFTAAEVASLRRLARSSSPADRRLCLEYLHRADLESAANRRLILALAGPLISRVRGGPLWKVFRILGNMVERHPEDVWPIVERWGAAESREVRSALAGCILEHLLEHHFRTTIGGVRKLLGGAPSGRRFASTLDSCYRLGQAAQPGNGKVLDELLARFRGPERRRCAAGAMPV